MRTVFLWGVLWACLQATSIAQTIPAYDPATDSTNIAYQNQLHTIFDEVDLSQVPSGVLYEHGYPFIAIEAFTGRLADSTRANSMAFGLAYASIASMVVDSTKVLPDPDAYIDVYDTLSPHSNVIPIMGLHQNYHYMDSTALDDSLFIVTGDHLEDVPGRSRSPYLEEDLFLFASLTPVVSQPSFSLFFDSDHFYTNTGKTVDSLWIDMGNGQGYQQVDFDQNIPVYATEAGRMLFKVKLTYTDSTEFYARFELVVTQSTSMVGVDDAPDMIYDIPEIPADPEDPATGRNGGTIHVFLACGHERIEKPFIWAEAYNPEIGFIEAGLNSESILRRLRHDDAKVDEVPLLDYLTENGYDIIVIDYEVGTDYLPRTAECIKEAIRWVNIQKASAGHSAKNVILGQSMGGVATMQALREMENESEDHECEKFIIFDSPIRGVNIPLAAQASLLDISNMLVNLPFDGEPEAPLFYFVPQVRDILKLYYAPATRTMMTERVPSLYDDYEGVEKEYLAYFDLLGYETEHLYEEHYGYLHGAMGGMPEDCEVIAIANGSQTTTPGEGAHNYNAGDKVIDVTADHYAIGTIVAGLFTNKIDSEPLDEFFDTKDVVFNTLSLFLWRVGRTSTIEIDLYAMENSTDFMYYRHQSKVSILLTWNITKHYRKAFMNDGLEVDNAPGGFFGIKNQGIFFPEEFEDEELEFIEQEDVLDEFKMHTWCFTPTGSVLNFYDPTTTEDWKSNLHRSYTNPAYDITNNFTKGIDMYHANRTPVTFDADPVEGREYANTAHTWFTSDQSEFLLYFLVGKDELDGVTELTSGTTFNYGKTAILPTTDYEGTVPTRTSSILDHSLTVNDTRLSVNANEPIGLTPSPYGVAAPGATENNSHFVLMIGNACDASPSVTLEITSDDGEFEIGHYGTSRYASVLVQSGHDLVVKDGGVITVNPKSTLKLNEGGDIHIENGGKLIIEDYASFITESGSTIHLYEGGEIEFGGSQAKIDIGGNLHLHENAEFNPTHVGVSSGMVIWSSVDGEIIANAGSVFRLIGDGSTDPLLTIRENTQLIAPETLDQFLLGSCKVLFRSAEDYPLQTFAPFSSTNVNYHVQDTLETLMVHPAVACFNKSIITSSEFLDVCLHIEEAFEIEGYYALLSNTDFELTYNLNTGQLNQVGGNISLHNCNFDNYATQAMNLLSLTGYSQVLNSDFTSESIDQTGLGIYHNSSAEILVKNSTFSNGAYGLYQLNGQGSLKCNTFTNNKIGVHGSIHSRIEMSDAFNMGYNSFNNVVDHSVRLSYANFMAIRGGYNKFYDDGTSNPTIEGSLNIDLPAYLALPGAYNRWNAGGTDPGSGELNIVDAEEEAVVYSLADFISASCGLHDPYSPPVVPIGDHSGSYLPTTELTGEANSMRLDSAISFAHENTTYWDETADNRVAIGYYEDILTYPYSIAALLDKRVQFHLREAYNQMKTTVYKSFADSLLLKTENQIAFDSTVQKYVDVLNHLTLDDTVSGDAYHQRFKLEMDKAHLFRLLGETAISLDIIQNVNLCPLDSIEQETINYWLFVFNEELAKQQIGLKAYGVDTVYSDTTVYYMPTSTQINEAYFGSSIHSMSSVTYRSCTGTKQPEFELETEKSFRFNLFPNPNNGQMQVEYELQDDQQGDIVIFAPDGKLILSQQMNQGIHNDFIDISHVNSGIYIYVVRVNGEIEKTGRISVAH